MFDFIINWMWKMFIDYMPEQIDENEETFIYYKELWGYRKIIEIKMRYK